MKRYFDMPDKRQVVEFDIEKGSSAATASAEEYSKVFKVKMREIDKSEYQRLAKEYTK